MIEYKRNKTLEALGHYASKKNLLDLYTPLVSETQEETATTRPSDSDPESDGEGDADD